ncbi:Mothers against decapentaplegic like protein [Argiope bruennichi]|uniref:Mothers against decapentaplegic like protein n=1 Tax=Argiope bruennichi TaxID=94029 RepID=A0A8T0F173_ARGBR|nr:Mothers against decapentaplegic like protein [Argiope bruennichi]
MGRAPAGHFAVIQVHGDLSQKTDSVHAGYYAASLQIAGHHSSVLAAHIFWRLRPALKSAILLSLRRKEGKMLTLNFIMFHFLNYMKRSCLIKRLSRISTNEAQRSVEAILRRLELADLETLAVSVESLGTEETPCIPLPMGEEYWPSKPHVVFCQLWRWADLHPSHELRRLPNCQTSQDPLYICANPYHWSRLYKPDTPLPPYSTLPQELPKVEDDTSIASDPVSPESRFSSNSGMLI